MPKMTIRDRNDDTAARVRYFKTLSDEQLVIYCSMMLARELGAKKLALGYDGVSRAATKEEAFPSYKAWLTVDGTLADLRTNMCCIARTCKHVSRYRVNSYSGKHALERARGTYVTNDEFIVAALMLGFVWSDDAPNLLFKLDYRV